MQLFKPKNETFLLLHLSPRGTTESVLSVDLDKQISIAPKADRFSLGAVTSRLHQRPVIAVADSTLATTLELPISFRRVSEHAEQPAASVELENALSQVLDRSFGTLRKNAASALKVDELDTVLVGATAKAFSIDGHAVVNPIGFSGSLIRGLLELTFAHRQVFDALKDHFNASEGFFFTHERRALMSTLFKLEPRIGFLSLRPERSLFFVRDPKTGQTIRHELKWSFADLLETLALKVPIQDDPASGHFLGGAFAVQHENDIAPILKRSLNRLGGELKRSGRVKTVYVMLSEPLPFLLPRKEAGVHLVSLPLSLALQKFGFTLRDEHAALADAHFRELAPFFEFYQTRGDSEVNRALRRKIHWLAG